MYPLSGLGAGGSLGCVQAFIRASTQSAGILGGNKRALHFRGNQNDQAKKDLSPPSHPSPPSFPPWLRQRGVRIGSPLLLHARGFSSVSFSRRLFLSDVRPPSTRPSLFRMSLSPLSFSVALHPPSTLAPPSLASSRSHAKESQLQLIRCLVHIYIYLLLHFLFLMSEQKCLSQAVCCLTHKRIINMYVVCVNVPAAQVNSAESEHRFRLPFFFSQ